MKLSNQQLATNNTLGEALALADTLDAAHPLDAPLNSAAEVIRSLVKMCASYESNKINHMYVARALQMSQMLFIQKSETPGWFIGEMHKDEWNFNNALLKEIGII